MANYCHNAVAFSGSVAQLLKMTLCFAELARDLDERNTAGLPDFIELDHGHLCDLVVKDNRLSYRTRWEPNLEVIFRVAEHFGLDYTHRYEEPGMCVYGEATCTAGEFVHVRLDGSDMRKISYDGATEMFTYQDKADYEPYGFWKTLLEEKKAALAATPPMFRTSSTVSPSELTALYGELLTGDLFLKLAEHKNFQAAKELFETWDEETVVIMDNFMIAEFQETGHLNRTRDEYIALLFLQDLIDHYEPENPLKLTPGNAHNPGLKR